MTSLFLNQMDILKLRFTKLCAVLDKTDNLIFLKVFLWFWKVSPSFCPISLAVLFQSFQIHWPLTSLYLFSEHVNHLHGTKIRRCCKAHNKTSASLQPCSLASPHPIFSKRILTSWVAYETNRTHVYACLCRCVYIAFSKKIWQQIYLYTPFPVCLPLITFSGRLPAFTTQTALLCFNGCMYSAPSELQLI